MIEIALIRVFNSTKLKLFPMLTNILKIILDR
jgi:hypothetical protein